VPQWAARPAHRQCAGTPAALSTLKGSSVARLERSRCADAVVFIMDIQQEFCKGVAVLVLELGWRVQGEHLRVAGVHCQQTFSITATSPR